jgi:hypothetical protein
MAEDHTTTRLQGRTVEKVGVIIVHGIGEQRRFEFLEGETRKIVNAIIAKYGARRRNVTPTLETGSGDAFLGVQRSWTSGGTAPLHTLVELSDEKIIDIAFHEVWWADINEKPTLWKQLRFWAWGLSLAGIATHTETALPGAQDHTRPPANAGKLTCWNRIRMGYVSALFGLSAFSVAFVNLILKQLGFAPFPLTETIINYLSGVKLYNQNIRAEGSPMDGPDEPPRAAIRRRMIRTMIDVASAGYDRWYILAHSLGTVVAWNGLMETAQALPNYLDRNTWDSLKGNPLRNSDTPFNINAMLPNRPLWLNDCDIINRKVLFENFRGILTYGSPLERFCALWSALVPLNKDEYVFRNAEWVNVYDPTDPVGTWLSDYNPEHKPQQILTSLKPANFPCRASRLLLYSHLCYLKSPSGHAADSGNFLVNQIARWLVSGESLVEKIDEAAKAAHTFWMPRAETPVATRRHLIFRVISRFIQAGFVALVLTIATLLSLEYVIAPTLKTVGVWLSVADTSFTKGWAGIWPLHGSLSSFRNLVVNATVLWLVLVLVVLSASLVHYRLSTNEREAFAENIRAQKSKSRPHFH